MNALDAPVKRESHTALRRASVNAPTKAASHDDLGQINSAAHAQFGHRFSQISAEQPPIQRQEAEEAEEEELQMKADTSATPIQREEADESEDEEIQMKPDSSATPLQREEADESEEEELQMKSEGGPVARPNVPVASGGGSALPEQVLDKMESSFGHSFSDVRVHQGAEAKQVGALAYTRGANIHFQPGLYDPDSQRGQELLGHELTHVIQQKAGRVAAPQSKADGAAPINADTGLESEADAMGARAARGQSVQVQGASGGGLQRKADVVQCFPWGAAKNIADTEAKWGGYGLDIAGTGTAAAAAGQDWSGVANSAHSISQAPSSISNGDMSWGASNMLGAFSLPSAAIGVGQGFKDVYKGAKTRDLRRGMEGAGGVVSGLTSMAGSVSGMVQGGALLSHASSLAGAAGAAVAPLGLVTSTFGLGKSMYQGVTAHQKRNELKGLSEGIDANASPDLKAAADFAADVQRKRRNRAGINTASNALIAGGAAATLAGSAGMGVGAAVGAGLAGGGIGLKYGSLATRKVKQYGRDHDWKHFDSSKSTTEKKKLYTQHIGTIMGNRDVGSQIFEGLGANKSQLKKFDEYHSLKEGQRPLTKEDSERLTMLEGHLQGLIKGQLKKRE